jgi:transcriptional regulator with XRE-family HTH domain
VKKSEDASPNYLLRSARESRGWTQEELAERIGTTGVTVSRWESGVTVPSRHFRKKLSAIYETGIQELGLVHESNGLSERKSLPSSAPQNVQLSTYSLPALGASASPCSAVRSEPVFLFNESLPTLGEFYGRRRERETLLNRTFRRASTSIVGPRRIGKTWLVDYLRLSVPKEFGTRFRVGYLDATIPSCKTIAGFSAEALEVLSLPASSSYDGLIGLEKGLKALSARNRIPILCIDEFEGLGDRQEFPLDFFRGLRAMTHSFGLVLVTISRNPLSTVVGRDVETSGFFNIFEQLTLEPFDADEAGEFIEEKCRQAGFTQQQREALWKYGEESEQEWPPLRLQLVGKLLLEDREYARADTIDWQKFEQRLEDAYRGVVY